MLFDGPCPTCGEKVSQDTMFAGTKRPCSACGVLFVVTVPDEVRAAMRAGAQKKAQASAPAKVAKSLEALTCASCLSETRHQVVAGTTTSRCPVCGAVLDTQAAIALSGRYQGLEEQFFALLLGGASGPQVEAALVPQGATPGLVQALLTHRTRLLPVVRLFVQGRQASGQMTNVPLRMPPVCDLCRAQPPQPVAALMEWRLLLSEEESVSAVSALTIFGGAIVTRTERSFSVIKGLYATCAGCFAHFDRLFGNTWKGYPADQGYELVTFKKLG